MDTARAAARTLQDARIPERIVQDCFLDGSKDEADVRCVGGLGQTGRVLADHASALPTFGADSLWIKVQVSSVDLVEPPE